MIPEPSSPVPKLGSPDVVAIRLTLRFGKGIDRLGEIIDAGVDSGIIQKSGSWYSFGEQRLGQGREQAREALEQFEEEPVDKEARA